MEKLKSESAFLIPTVDHPAPFLLRLASPFGAGAVDDGELVAPFPGARGVNDGAGVHQLPGFLVLRADARVERG